MKRLVLLAAFAVLAVPQAFAGPWLKSVAEAQKQAKTKNQLIFVDLFAEWCGWCHRAEQEIFPSMVFQNASDDLVLLRLDTEDNGDGTSFARKYQVTSLPTFLMIAPDGTLAGIIRGYAPPNDFVKMMKETREKYGDFIKRVKNESSIAKDYPKRIELAREFVGRQAYTQSDPRFKKLTTETGVPVVVRDQAYYELAVSQVLQKKYGDAQATIGKLKSISKSGEWYERVHLLNAQIYVEQGNYLGAANELRNFKSNFPNSPLIRNVDMVLPDIERRLAASKSPASK